MSEEFLRIKKLLEHWLEHNKEHVNRFREVAKEAESMGMSETAAEILAAADKGDEVSTHLKKASESIA